MDQEYLQSYHALQIAFQTMKERCQQLQAKLFETEKENACLRQQYRKCNAMDVMKMAKDEEEDLIIQNQQKKIEELNKEKCQLINHIHMVSSENHQLWKRLSKLIHDNKSLSNQLIKISDTSKQQPSNEIPTFTYCFSEILEIFKPNVSENDIVHDIEEQSLKEIPLCLINSIATEKSELKQQYAKTKTKINLKNMDFAYAEDINESSPEHFKIQNAKLVKIKELLLSQQNQLNNTLQNLRTINKSNICNSCKTNVENFVHQTNTQSDVYNILKENEATQTSFSTSNDLVTDVKMKTSDNNDKNICPLCGIAYKKTLSFDLFHEHVVSHFIKDDTDNLKIN